MSTDAIMDMVIRIRLLVDEAVHTMGDRTVVPSPLQPGESERECIMRTYRSILELLDDYEKTRPIKAERFTG